MKPLILLANQKGEFFEDHNFNALGMEGDSIVSLPPEDLIPLPKGSKIFLISDSIPLGLDKYGLVKKNIQIFSCCCLFASWLYKNPSSCLY